jgi:hypothetical protein
MDLILSDSQISNPNLIGYAFFNMRDTNPLAKLPQQAQRYVESEIQYYEFLGPEYWIVNRSSFRAAAAQGKSVVELTPADQKAVIEIQRIYRKVYGHE